MHTNTRSLSLYGHQIVTLMYNSVLHLIMYTNAQVRWINLYFNISTITLKPKCDMTDQVLYIYSENSICMPNLYHKCSRFQILHQIIHILRLVFVKTFLCVPMSQNHIKLANSYLAQKMALNRTVTQMFGAQKFADMTGREAQCNLYILNKIDTVLSTLISVPSELWCRCGNRLIKPAVATNNLCLAYTCRTPWN